MSVPVAFWALQLGQANVVQRISVSKDFCITNIALGEDIDGNKRTCVKVHYYGEPVSAEDSDEESEEEEEEEEEEDAVKANGKGKEKEIEKNYVIASLTPGKIEQSQTNLTFSEGEEIGFSINTNSAVHLLGNFIVPPEGFDQPPVDSDDDSEGYGSLDEEFYSDENEDEDDEEEEEGDSGRFEEIQSRILGAKRRASEAMDIEGEEGTKEGGAESKKLSKNERKKLAKKAKTNDGSAVEPSAAPKEQVKKAEATKEKVTEKKAGKEPSKEKAEAKKDGQTATKKTKLDNGLIIEDVKVGTGKVAKPGNKIGMRYIGRLQNGKQFDANTSGKPFYFKLGAGEVIKGWDQGIKGMQVGGERKLTIPAKLAYGNQSIPGIPKNSTLNFEVKLVEIK